MLLMHGLSYGPALTRNTKERASVCQSNQVGLRPPRLTSHTILTRTIFSSMSFIPNCRAGYHQFLESSCRTYTSSILSIVSPIFLQNGTVWLYFVLFLTFSALVANPKKTTLHGGQSRSWSAEQGKKEKRKSLAAHPPPPPARAARSEKK